MRLGLCVPVVIIPKWSNLVRYHSHYAEFAVAVRHGFGLASKVATLREKNMILPGSIREKTPQILDHTRLKRDCVS